MLSNGLQSGGGRRGSEAEQKWNGVVAHDGRIGAETEPSGNGAEEKGADGKRTGAETERGGNGAEARSAGDGATCLLQRNIALADYAL